jgi:hypothetical protein
MCETVAFRIPVAYTSPDTVLLRSVRSVREPPIRQEYPMIREKFSLAGKRGIII